MPPPAEHPSRQKLERIREVVAHYLREASDNGPAEPQAWTDRHPELMPELADQLRFAAMAWQAGQAAGPAAFETSSRQSSLTVRCPHCQEVVHIEQDVDWCNVTCLACGSSFGLVGDESVVSDLQPGRFIGRFELVRSLGKGTFGAVWEALDPQLDRHVALKIPRRGDLTPTEAELFLREARAAAQIRHPHIVPIHEVGRVGDRIYLVCDYIAGETLAERLARDPFSMRETLQLVEILAHALQHVHEQGVIHRDLKPGNVLLDGSQQPYLADFGLARRLAGDLTLTCDGQIVGTPAYMPPEQATGAHAVDRRSDIYSLGVILYELLTGQLPFQGTPQAVVHQLLHDEPRSPRKLNPRISRDLETICLKCLEKDPQRRYDSAGALADDLLRLQRSEPIAVRPTGRIVRAVRWSRRKPLAATLLGILLALAVVTPPVAVRYQRLASREAAARKATELAEQRRAEQLYVSRIAAVQQACRNDDYRRARTLLNSLMPAGNEQDLRGFEWYLFDKQLRRGLEWEMGPYGRLSAVATSPDGRWLACGGYEGVLRIRNLVTQETTDETFIDEEGKPVPIYSLAFSPNLPTLAVGTSSNSVIVVTDMQRLDQKTRLPTQGGWIESLQFSPDGRTLAAGLHEGGTVEFWTDLDAASHQVIRVGDDPVRMIAFSPDGALLATVGGPYDVYPSRNTIQLVDLAAVQITGSLPPSTQRSFGLQFSPDGKTLFSSQTTFSVDCLKVPSLQQEGRMVLKSHSFATAIAVSPDGKSLVAGGWDGELVRWDIASHRVVETWPGHLETVMSIAWFPDGHRMATCGFDGFIRCWRVGTSERSPFLTGLRRPQLQFSPDGSSFIVFVSTEQGGCVYQARSTDNGQVLWEFSLPRVRVGRFSLTPDGKTLVVPDGPEIRFHDAGTGKLLHKARSHRDSRYVSITSVSPNGRWLATGGAPFATTDDSQERSEDVVLWDLRTRKAVKRWRAHGRRVSEILFGPSDDELVTYGWDKVVRRWRISTGALLTEYAMGIKIASGLAWADSGRILAAVDSDGNLWRWSVLDGSLQPLVGSRDGNVGLPAEFRADPTWVIPCGPRSDFDLSRRGSVKLVDLRTWETKATIDVCPGQVWSVAMSPAGDVLLAADASGNIYRWCVDRGSGLPTTSVSSSGHDKL